ncbi:MAG: ABC transporter ATP-binding protein [Marinomonas sp.]
MNLEFQNIGHHYASPRASKPALADINLHVPSGKITCLLGSSGCGKTTLLNLAAGLLEVQQGSIALDGAVLADPARNPAPEHRPIGLVFQDGALFPHMTIAENILFGVAKPDRSPQLAQQWLDMIGLSGLGERYPAKLSGGQQQRVALARAMAPEPAVLLLDEPFASIDVVLRRDLRRECRRLLKARNATAIMVTHDPEEAMDIADTIAVMESGAIIQADTPAALYNTPASLSVGMMFGEAQSVTATVTAQGLETPFGVWPTEALAQALPAGTKQADLLIREGSLRAAPSADGLIVKDVRHRGRSAAITLANDSAAEIWLEHAGADNSLIGSQFAITPKHASLIAFPR